MSDEKNHHVGFLSIISTDFGHCGGLLVVNRLGRPVEFHCTSPVVENRTQKILYGQTYHRYLFSEQIGTVLVDKIQKPIQVLVTDRPEIAAEASELGQIIALTGFNGDDDIAMELANHPPVCRIEVGSDNVALFAEEADVSSASDALSNLVISIPLSEPFVRIRHAIEEAVGEAVASKTETRAA